MKKYLVLFIGLIMSMLSTATVFAETDTALKESMNSIWMKQYPDICRKVQVLAEMDAESYAQSAVNDEGLKHKYGSTFEEEVQSDISHYKMVNTPNVEDGYRFFHLDIPKYAVQYAEAGNIDYLLKEYWIVPKKTYRKNQDVRWDFFDINADSYNISVLLDLKGTAKPVIPFDMVEYVSNIDAIEELLKEAGAQDFLDFKVIDINSIHTVLYFKYSNNEYGILIRDADNNTNKPDIEHLKVYDFSYILKKIGDTQTMGVGGRTISTKELLYKKDVYKSEAEALNQVGLLKGNENGLDLLKPLTRAEAITLLIRAMGLEENALANSNQNIFIDMYNTVWAIPYAVCAYERGITTETEDGLFNPECLVTADQFSTFVLRASGEHDIDYTKGTQILIDRNIITAEQAETMDLFTRGDMAKIIYKAREKGLMNGLQIFTTK
ncbi:MAG: hypothetical protein Q4G33_08695 [bacterium]|nr:hypothetical protein [bacterium]